MEVARKFPTGAHYSETHFHQSWPKFPFSRDAPLLYMVIFTTTLAFPHVQVHMKAFPAEEMWQDVCLLH